MIVSLARACAAALLGTACTIALSCPAHAAKSLPLDQAVAALPQAAESRDGYERTSFTCWNAGAHPDDGCDTRAEVLMAEAIEPPATGPDCKLKGGTWSSYYDDRRITSAAAMDVDHMVPLPEAWDSGTSQWTAARREAYANDLADPRSLVAVSAAAQQGRPGSRPVAAAQHQGHVPLHRRMDGRETALEPHRGHGGTRVPDPPRRGLPGHGRHVHTGAVVVAGWCPG
ncbi:HNH endonuclease [Streptomyces sp. NPDC006235]|uniref:HNH endonuclease n=1 Tax=Streptomyces sp. NPDC006235 TaxID=3156736 RepID=UPI0033A5B589